MLHIVVVSDAREDVHEVVAHQPAEEYENFSEDRMGCVDCGQGYERVPKVYYFNGL